MPHQTLIRAFAVAVSVLFATLFMSAFDARTAHAQDPLRLSIVNAAADGGGDAHEKLSTFLQKSDDIATTPQEEVWAAAKKLDLAEKDFRSGSLREKNTREFQKIMRELDLEALLILDVFGRGKTLQLVAIGPSGKEITDEREEISGGQPDNDEAKDVLKRTFKDLVPVVKDFRDAGGWDAIEEEEEAVEEEVSLLPEDDGEEDGEEGEVSLKDEVIAKKRGEGGPLAPGYHLQAGLLLGKRTISMGASTGFELTHDSPFAGVGGRVVGVFSRLSADSAVGAEIFGGYAPFTTIFTDPNNPEEQEPYQSAYARIGVQARLLYGFGSSAYVEGLVGAEAFSITVDQNPFYTGNRYLAGRAGALLGYQVGPVLLNVGGAILPIFGVNNSSGAYGETGFTLGLEGDVRLGFGLTDDIGVSLGYTFHLINADYEGAQVVAATVETTDMIHSGMVMIGYRL